MKPRTFARRPSSIGSNQLSKSRPSASPARAHVILLIMAWSPPGAPTPESGLRTPETTPPNSNPLRDGTHRAAGDHSLLMRPAQRLSFGFQNSASPPSRLQHRAP